MGEWRATPGRPGVATDLPLFITCIPMWGTVNGGLPLLAGQFFEVVYVDTDAKKSSLE